MRAHLSLIIALSAGIATAQILCIQGITTTIGYETALKPKGTSCPVNEAKGISYYSANSAGCCTSTATAKTLGTQGAACCPCGALCTGFFPPIMDWEFNTADQLILTPTGSSGSAQTVVPTTPFHGPYTADTTTDLLGNPSGPTSGQATPTAQTDISTIPSSSSTHLPTTTTGPGATTSSSVLPTASSASLDGTLLFSIRKAFSLSIATVLLAFVILT